MNVNDNDTLLVWIAKIIREQQERSVYGEVRIQFKAGRVQGIKVEQSILPPKGIDTDR